MNLKYLCGWETYLKITDRANAATVLLYFFSRSAGVVVCNSAVNFNLVCYIIIFCLFQINIFDMMDASIEIH